MNGNRSHAELSKGLEQDKPSDEETTSDEDNGGWYPGDGVCPSASQFNAVYQTSYDSWHSAASRPTHNATSNRCYMEAFLDLLQDVPAFFHNPPRDVDVRGGHKSPLTLRSTLELGTTEDTSCERRSKAIDYLQCLGFSAPRRYEILLEAPTSSSGPAPNGSGYFTSIVLAWSYIISCRWVEILQHAGEKSSLRHSGGEQSTRCFWDLVIQSRWIAQVKIMTGTFYAPWMLRTPEVEKCSDMLEVSPDSSLAFDILAQFCASEGLEEEFVTGLATVLMLTSRHIPPPKLNPPMMIAESTMPSRNRDARSDRVFWSIDKCMSLSSTQDALDSLLCSVFFDPCVPCNLMGAASLGITDALFLTHNDYQRLVEAITDREPPLAVLWKAVVRSGQARPLLTMALKSLPPICLAAALWTNTIQSFLQVAYSLDGPPETLVPRSREFGISYFCRPDASVPWTPAPPFGSTSKSNLSLDVRQHYRHGHMPLWWRSYWIVQSGERIPASPQNWFRPLSVCSLPSAPAVDPEGWQQQFQRHEQRIANEQSWIATSRLFNWHRYNEDGLWLDDGTAGSHEAIRKLQQHPWIIDPFEDDDGSDPLSEEEHSKLDILSWSAQVE